MSLTDKIKDGWGKVSKGASTAAEKTKDVAGDALDKTKGVAGTVVEKAKEVIDRGEKGVDETAPPVVDESAGSE